MPRKTNRYSTYALRPADPHYLDDFFLEVVENSLHGHQEEEAII